MPKQGEAKAGIQALNGKEISGIKMRVKKAEMKKSKDDNATSVDSQPDTQSDN